MKNEIVYYFEEPLTFLRYHDNSAISLSRITGNNIMCNENISILNEMKKNKYFDKKKIEMVISFYSNRFNKKNNFFKKLIKKIL